MICAQCGRENPEGARFCAYCGGVPAAPNAAPAPAAPPVARASRLPIAVAVAAMLVVGGVIAVAASRWGPVRGALGSLTGQGPREPTDVAAVQPGIVPRVPGALPPLPGSWGQGNRAPGAGAVQGGAPGTVMPGNMPSPTPGGNVPGGPTAPNLMGGLPGNAPGSIPGRVSANAPAGSITAGTPGAMPNAGSVNAGSPGGVSASPGGASVTAGSPGSLPQGGRVTAGAPGNAPAGRAVTAGTPGNQPAAPAVTGGQPGSTPSAPPVTGGQPGNVNPAAPVTAGQPGSVPAGRAVTGGQPGAAPTGPSVAAGTPGGTPQGRSVQGGQPPTPTPQRPRTAAPRGPDPREQNLVAEYLRRLAVIQAQDNQLNQQIGNLAGGWMGDANVLGGLEDPGQFLRSYGNIAQGFGRVGAAKQNLGNQFLNQCGPVARVCPPVQNLHNWYIRYFQEWVQATQTLYNALRNGNLGMAMQVQGMLTRAENTERQCQREEDRVRDKYDLPASPFGPR